MKLSGSLFSSLSAQSSHLSWTNHPNGIQFNVYSVHDLSFHKVVILGGSFILNRFSNKKDKIIEGSHNQNSLTFTQDFLAAVKCQNSCKTTSTIKAKIHNIIHHIYKLIMIKILCSIGKFIIKTTQFL